MAHRRGSFRRGGSGISESQRRKKTWTGLALAASVVNGFEIRVPTITPGNSILSLVFFSAADSLGLTESTLMRIRGSVSVPKSSLSVSEGFTVGFGIAMVTDEAAVAGSVPNPATPEGADWDGWLFFRSNTIGPADANATIMDAKAMRKFQGGTSLVFVGGNASNAGGLSAPEAVIEFVGRALFLLP